MGHSRKSRCRFLAFPTEAPSCPTVGLSLSHSSCLVTRFEQLCPTRRFAVRGAKWVSGTATDLSWKVGGGGKEKGQVGFQVLGGCV